MWEKIIEHGWKWALVGLLALIILPFLLVIAHDLESGRDRDKDRDDDAQERPDD